WRPASTRLVPAGTDTLRPSKSRSGTSDLLRARGRERTTAARHVLLEDRAEVSIETLHRLGRSRRVRAERVRPDGLVKARDEVEILRRGLAGLQSLEEGHAVGQTLAA